MKDKNLIYLILTLGICSGTMIVNHFIVKIPNWLAAILTLLATIFLITYFVKSHHKNNN